MAIPKVIHYCWFGRNPLPKAAIRCMESWKKYCPDYEIVEWNEDNFDIRENRYVEEAYAAGKWAFVSDYARLKVIYEEGGIYLDTDVEVIRNLDSLLDAEGFMGFQNLETVASGLGFGAVKHHPVIRGMMEDYADIPFLQEDGTMDTTPCPDRNTECLKKYGLCADGRMQMIEGIRIYPAEYFCPMDWKSGITRKTKNTFSIHHFDGSWMSSYEQFWMKVRLHMPAFFYRKLRYRLVEPFLRFFTGKPKNREGKKIRG